MADDGDALGAEPPDVEEAVQRFGAPEAAASLAAVRNEQSVAAAAFIMHGLEGERRTEPTESLMRGLEFPSSGHTLSGLWSPGLDGL